MKTLEELKKEYEEALQQHKETYEKLNKAADAYDNAWIMKTEILKILESWCIYSGRSPMQHVMKHGKGHYNPKIIEEIITDWENNL